MALLLILGTNKLPEAAKKIGVLVGEYNKTKKDVQNKMNDFSTSNISIQGPVKNNRQKLETIAKSLNIDIKNKTDTELQKIIHTIIENEEKNKS